MSVSKDNSYFQRLSLCETIQRAAVVIASDVVVFAQLSFVVVGTYVLVWGCMLPFLMPAMGLDADQLEVNDTDYLAEHIGAFDGFVFINMFVYFLTTAVGNGALVRAVAELYLHRRPSVWVCIQVGISNAITIIVASILAYLASVIGLFFVILPGIYLMVKWVLLNPAIIVERLGVIAALKRSWNLTTNRWCYVFGIDFICTAFGIALHLIWSRLFHVNAYTFYGTVVGSIPSFIVTPVVEVMIAVTYINLRVEKEGLTAEVLSGDLGFEADYSSMTDHVVQQETDKTEMAVSNIV